MAELTEVVEAFAEDFVKNQLAKSVQEKMSTFEQETMDMNMECNNNHLVEEDKLNETAKMNGEVEVHQEEPEIKMNGAMETVTNVEVHQQEPDNNQASQVVPVVTVDTIETVDQTLITDCPISTTEYNVVPTMDDVAEQPEKEVKQESQDANDSLDEVETITETIGALPECPMATMEENPEVTENATPSETIQNGIGSTNVVEINGTNVNNEKTSKNVIEPGHGSLAKHSNGQEQETMRKNFKKLGINETWWKKNKTNDDDDNDGGVSVADKFGTIKQNIQRGNTRSLKARFEQFGKLNE